MIHRTAHVDNDHVIDDSTKVWQNTVIIGTPVIGKHTVIGAQCLIENAVMIGKDVTIKPLNYIPDGVIINDGVFIGANVTFTNDRHPVSKNRDYKMEKIIIGKNTSIGAGAIILPGITIGANVLVGAGALITKDVPSNSTVYTKTSTVTEIRKPKA